MATLRDLLQHVTERLESAGQDVPRREAEFLLMDALGLSRSQLLLELMQEASPEQEERVLSYLGRREKGEPLAYIHGELEFYGLALKVTPAVLIPRPETELLVDHIAQELASQDLTGKVLWDLCCGSGCIGLALKKRFPDLNVVLSDLSDEALRVAKSNAEGLGLEIDGRLGDLLEPFTGEKAHFVVSNPPYLSAGEYGELDAEVKDFEPRSALEAGDSGLEIYRRLASELPSYLHPEAKVYLEIGYRQGTDVQGLFGQESWKETILVQDLAGHDRFLLSQFAL